MGMNSGCDQSGWSPLSLLPTACPCIEGDGRMHECLRSHRAKLTEACRREERILEEQEAENINLKPTLLKVREGRGAGGGRPCVIGPGSLSQRPAL